MNAEQKRKVEESLKKLKELDSRINELEIQRIDNLEQLKRKTEKILTS